MSFLGEELSQLVQMVGKLPGLGSRSAQRIALHLLKHKETLLPLLIEKLNHLQHHYDSCVICGYMDEGSPCRFCACPQRNNGVICVVVQTGDIWALERANFFKGRYHVLGGVLSSVNQYYPEHLNIEGLLDRLSENIHEIILALNSTVEGQTTFHYLAKVLLEYRPDLTVSTLAKGIPMGGELDYLDSGTLLNAFLERKKLPSQESLSKESVAHLLEPSSHPLERVSSLGGLSTNCVKF